MGASEMNSEEFYERYYPLTWILTKVYAESEEVVILRDPHGKIITKKRRETPC